MVCTGRVIKSHHCLLSTSSRTAQCPPRAVAHSRPTHLRLSSKKTPLFSGESHIPCSRAGKNSRRRTASVIVHADADYYAALGVSQSADKREIKSAYRQKARKFHPDVNKEPGAEEAFKKISEAYEVLSDDDKRRIYDQYGEAGLKGGMGGFGGASGMGDFSNPFDLFESFFGGGMGGFGGAGGAGTRTRGVPGDDLRAEAKLSFLEAVFGTNYEVTVSHLVTCTSCDGSGVKKGTKPTTCTQCNGTGQVVSSMRTPLGTFQQIGVCPTCQGSGQIFEPCDSCQGDGRVNERKKISVSIPAGVDSGSRLRVRGEGNAGKNGGPTGDLYVFIEIRPHPKLRRDGTTIHTTIEISYVEAILGTTVKVPTVDGEVDLKVPAGCQPETTLLMAKRGVPSLNNPNARGDQKVRVRIKIPKKLNNEERSLIKKLQDIEENKTHVGPFTF